MPALSLLQITRHCDRLLRVPFFTDFDGAHNGLQVENDGRVTRLAAAVDASLATVRLAAAQKADLLVVHHGLFWSSRVPWTGVQRELIGALVHHNLAVYSAHLPLDAHPRLGNNVLLAAALGLRALRPFYREKGRAIGVQTRTAISRERLAARLAKATGATPVVLAGGPAVCRRSGVVTGGAGSGLRLAAAEGVDTFITGEGPHHTHALAAELGVNVFYGGHYATETFGVKALAAHLSRKFRVPWCFVDDPSGL